MRLLVGFYHKCLTCCALAFKVFVLMQFDPGMEYRPADYRASGGYGLGANHKVQGGMMGGMPPPGILPAGRNLQEGMGQHGMGVVHRGVGLLPGIMPPPSQQVILS